MAEQTGDQDSHLNPPTFLNIQTPKCMSMDLGNIRDKGGIQII